MKTTISILTQNGALGHNLSIGGLALLTAIFFPRPAALAQTENRNTMKTHISKTDSGITIRQEIYFMVSPQQLYEALLSSKKFSESTSKSYSNFSTTSAKIDSTVGGTFSVFDGHIIGRNLELLPYQRIVQAWRVVDWPPGAYSIVRYEIKTQGSGTKLIFEHIGFPQGEKKHLATGWKEHYWDALRKYFQ